MFLELLLLETIGVVIAKIVDEELLFGELLAIVDDGLIFACYEGADSLAELSLQHILVILLHFGIGASHIHRKFLSLGFHHFPHHLLGFEFITVYLDPLQSTILLFHLECLVQQHILGVSSLRELNILIGSILVVFLGGVR